ncbi:MAG TPA: SRPBCC family protein [Chitinophagaceae bacterium]|jgi:uncharacterized protein YndB with AHSA1/START domain|nr:SRPBCC family protein [Chitinophagaceae bacterium]
MVTDTVLSPGKELTITKVLNAPIELVWKVWTDPDHIKNWWGPNGFTNTMFEMDLRPGGSWEFIMHGPDGTDYKNKSIFREIVKHKRIVYEHVTGPKFQTTVNFTPQGKKTLLEWRMVFDTEEERDKTVKTFKADIGLKQNIFKLEGYLRSVSPEKEMTMTRVIDVARDVVFRAWTDPAQVEKWWGPKDFTNPVCMVDARPGGEILIHMQAPDRTVYPMDGEFHEIVEPVKLVFTCAALDKQGNRLFEILNTVLFSDEDGKTKISLHAAISNITEEGRPYLDGMNDGWNQSFDRLNDLVSDKNRNEDRPVTIKRIFNAPVENVWKAITDINQMRVWYFPQLENFKPEKGFETQFNVHHEGKDFMHLWKVKEVMPLKKISIEWKYAGYPGSSLVSFELFPEGNRTRLVLTHEGVESFMPAKYPELAKKNFIEGWTAFMDKELKEFLEK